MRDLMPSAKKVLRKFLDHVSRAQPGDALEVGLTYDAENGWRVYQRIGDKALAMDPKHARGLHAAYERLASKPEWVSAARGLMNTLGELRLLADEADQKNRDKVVPPGYADAMPTWGTA